MAFREPSSRALEFSTRSRVFPEMALERAAILADATWGLMRDWIHLIAGATYPFPAVLRALSQPMSVFPIEGLPGARYFPGTGVMDEVEERSEVILQRMFGTTEHRATIQPHSGTQANQIVYRAILKTGDGVLALSSRDGGHISHTVLLGKSNAVMYYPLEASGTIDYAALHALVARTRPRLVIAGGSALPREVDFERIAAIAHEHDALLHADVSHTAALIVGRAHRPVAPDADFITFNMAKNMRGPAGGVLLYRATYAKQVARALFPLVQGGPNESAMFGKYVALEMLMASDMNDYARRIVVLAQTMADAFARRGLSVVSGGTDSHIVLIDLRPLGIGGSEAERRCEAQRILLNRNLVPGDEARAESPSGIRIGSVGLAILGYSEADVSRLADAIADVVLSPVADARPLVDELTRRYNHPFASSF